MIICTARQYNDLHWKEMKWKEIKETRPAFLIYDEIENKIVKRVEFQEELSSDLSHYKKNKWRPFGITYDENYIYLGCNEKIGLYDRDFNFKGIFSNTGFTNTHEILSYKNYIIRIDTYPNRITFIDKKTKEEIVVGFNLTKRGRIENKNIRFEEDVVHVNTVCVDKGFLYCMLHMRNYKPSLITKIEIKKIIEKRGDVLGEMLPIDIGWAAHNIEIVNDTIYNLSTEHGMLIITDPNYLNQKRIVLVDRNKYFLRGLFHKNGKLHIFASLTKKGWRKENCDIKEIPIKAMYITYDIKKEITIKKEFLSDLDYCRVYQAKEYK